MKTSGMIILFALILLSISLTFASAEIILSQPSSVYNLGDDFNLDAQITSVSDMNDFFISEFICPGNTVEFSKIPLSILQNQKKNLTVSARLDRSLIGGLSGECYLKAYYGYDEVSSQKFEISDSLSVNFVVDKTVVDPQETISISGTAKKENGRNVNGFAEISLTGTGLNLFSNVNSGSFRHNFSVPSASPSGTFNLEVKVYEKDSSGERTNTGSASTLIKVKQILKEIDVALGQSNVMPGDNLSFTVVVYDQSGSQVMTDVNAAIYSPSGLFIQKNVKSFQSYSIKIPDDAHPGPWNIEGFINSLNSMERQFIVNESKDSLITFNNQTITIKNTGNVPLNTTIYVRVDDIDLIQPIDLNVGQSKSFKVDAPEKEYNLTVMSGDEVYSFGSVFLSGSDRKGLSGLTGSAISLRDVEKVSSGSNMNLLLWLIIIFVLVLLVVYYFGKVRKGRFTGKIPPLPSHPHSFYPTLPSSKADYKPNKSMPQMNVKKMPPVKVVSPRPMFETYNPEPAIAANRSNNRLIVKEEGNREEAIILALKIKNSNRLSASESSAFNTIEHSLSKARMGKGKVYDHGESKVIVFSETYSPSSPVDVIKAAHDMDNMLKNFNRKFAIKIDYGIGINIGDVLSEIYDGRLKFTSIGTTVILAKNAAERANNEILVSQPFFRKIYNTVKSEPTSSGFYKILSVVDRSSHSQFIGRFMKKQ